MISNIFNHTADIGIKIKAKDIKILFSKCINKIIKLALINSRNIYKLNKKKLIIKNINKSYEDLLHDTLNEIIYLIFVKKYYISKINIKKLLFDKIIIEIFYRKLNKDEIIRELKCVTYHNLSIKRNKNIYITEFIIDT